MFGILVDAVIAIAITYYIDGGLIEFAFVFAGLYVLYFAIWLKKSLSIWVYFYMAGRKVAANAMVENFKAESFPKAERHVSSSQEYFKDVAEDQSQPDKVRLLAAQQVGYMLYPHEFHHNLELLFVAMAAEDAIEIHSAAK